MDLSTPEESKRFTKMVCGGTRQRRKRTKQHAGTQYTTDPNIDYDEEQPRHAMTINGSIHQQPRTTDFEAHAVTAALQQTEVTK